MPIYILGGNNSYMGYEFGDDELGLRLMGAHSGQVELPTADELPLHMVPSFGDAPKQPTALGDFHCFHGSRRLFSERAVEVLSLADKGHLFPVILEGRDEPFYWYWSTCEVDCLDESRTKRVGRSVDVPAFFEDRIGAAEIFFTPDDRKFQQRLYVTESVKTKIKKAKLTGFRLARSFFDAKAWTS